MMMLMIIIIAIFMYKVLHKRYTGWTERTGTINIKDKIYEDYK